MPWDAEGDPLHGLAEPARHSWWGAALPLPFFCHSLKPPGRSGGHTCFKAGEDVGSTRLLCLS